MKIHVAIQAGQKAIGLHDVFLKEMTKEDESLGKANYHSLLDRMRNLDQLHEAQFVCSLEEDDGA